MQADITGIGWVTSAGMGRGRKQQNFSMPCKPISPFNPEKAFKTPYPNLRRMDDYSRLGVSAIALTLADAGLTEWTDKRDIGIVGSTVYGCLKADVDYYGTVVPNRGAGASPAIFSYTSANSFLGEAAIRFGLTGTNYTVFEQCPTGLLGLRAALGHLCLGDDPKVMGGACDADCPQIFNQPDEVPPGAVFFMLERPNTGTLPSFGTLSSVSSGGLAFNNSPVGDIAGLVKQCLAAMHAGG